MKLFVCSDIHGNLRAFEAVLAEYRSFYPCNFLFLGDSIGYGSHPDAILDRLRNIPKSVMIMGNHEQALLDRGAREYMSVFAAEAIEWTHGLLKDEYIEWIRKKFRTSFKGRVYTAAHASPVDPLEWGYIYSSFGADHVFSRLDFRICFIGHTHMPKVYTSNDGEKDLPPGEEFELDSGDRYIVNVGSVGQPRDGDPRASCCLYDSKRNTLKLIRREYDVRSEAKDIVDAGLPEFLASRLLDGV